MERGIWSTTQTESPENETAHGMKILNRREINSQMSRAECVNWCCGGPDSRRDQRWIRVSVISLSLWQLVWWWWWCNQLRTRTRRMLLIWRNRPSSPSTALTHHLIDWSNGSHMLRCDLENSAITSTATTWYHLLLLYRLKATASP